MFGYLVFYNGNIFTPMKKTLQLPLSTRAAITQNSYNDTDKTIEVVFATETEVKRRTWDGTNYIEILSCKPENVRLERINSGANLVDSHSTYSIRSIIGVVERAWVEGKECKAIIRLSQRDEVAGYVQDIVSGITRNISVGYAIHTTDITEDSDKNTITVRVTDWEPAELSVVSVPADHNAGTRSQGQNQNFHEVNFNTRNMTPEEIAAAEAATRAANPTTGPVATPAVPVDQNAITTAATTAERTRIAEIQTAVRKHNITDVDFAQGLIENGSTIDQARAAILDKLVDNQTPPSRTSTATIGVEAIDKKRAAMENAIMHRANPSIELLPEAKEFRGMTLLDMGREMVEEAGGKTRGLSRMDLAKASLNIDGSRSAGMHSTSDFPILLGNTVNAVLAREYALQARTFPQWATRGTVKDFKEKSIVSVGDFSSFDEVKEGGEYSYGTFGEGAEKLKVVKYGKIIAVTWESLINDDLDIFSKIPRFMANAAARKQSDLVYSILLNNPNMADGVPLFHATHKNLATGSALDITNIGKARKFLRNQKAIDGEDFLNIMGKYLLVGPDQEEAALQYAGSKYVPNEMNKQNVWAGQFEPVIEPRITGNKWFLAADPSQLDTIEYAFLEGQPELFTEQRTGFEVDGLEIKARMVFGAKAIDHRGLVYNPGA